MIWVGELRSVWSSPRGSNIHALTIELKLADEARAVDAPATLLARIAKTEAILGKPRVEQRSTSLTFRHATTRATLVLRENTLDGQWSFIESYHLP